VSRLLKDAGYATAAAGKWQINDFRIEPQVMKEHGFDDWLMWTGYEATNPPSANRYADPYLNTPQGSAIRKGAFGPDLYTEHLIGFMQQNRDRPMFLYHAMALPHSPFVTTPDEPDAKSNLDKHKAMVRYMDKQVGRLVAAIDDLGLRDRTNIIFTTEAGATDGHADRFWSLALAVNAATITTDPSAITRLKAFLTRRTHRTAGAC
jgi:arylsulfatase A-like enzyme